MILAPKSNMFLVLQFTGTLYKMEKCGKI